MDLQARTACGQQPEEVPSPVTNRRPFGLAGMYGAPAGFRRTEPFREIWRESGRDSNPRHGHYEWRALPAELPDPRWKIAFPAAGRAARFLLKRPSARSSPGPHSYMERSAPKLRQSREKGKKIPRTAKCGESEGVGAATIGRHPNAFRLPAGAPSTRWHGSGADAPPPNECLRCLMCGGRLHAAGAIIYGAPSGLNSLERAVRRRFLAAPFAQPARRLLGGILGGLAQ